MDIVYSPSPLSGLEVLSCSGDHSFDSHLHEGYVLWLNSEAGEYYRLNGNSDILQPGTIGLIEPGVVHANRPCHPEKRHLRSFYFKEEFFKGLYEEISGGEGVVPRLGTMVIDDQTLWRQLILLHETLFHCREALEVESAIIAAFADLSGRCGNGRGVNLLQERCESRIATAIDFFHAHIDHQFSLGEVANLLGCTSYHLIRLFRQQKGMAPHAYLIQLRLEYARKFLEEGESIVDAALWSGFSDQSHLTRKFKLRYGVTPGLYQRQRLGRRTLLPAG